MKKRILSILMVVVMLIPTLNVFASGKNADQILQQISDAYDYSYSKNGGSFKGYCGRYVSYQLSYVGITNGFQAMGNGNNQYDNWKKKSTTSGGYKVVAYPGEDCLRDLMATNNNVNVYNILVGFESSPTEAGKKYGHVVFIHAIIDGKVYWSESSKWYGIPEGGVHERTVEGFYSFYKNHKYDGAIHFASENDIDADVVLPPFNKKPINKTIYNSHFYEVYDYKTTWETAKKLCEDKGGYLATITSYEEQNAVLGLVRELNKPCWIGAYRTSSGASTYQWVTGEALNYTNWDTNEPSLVNGNKSELYVGMYANDVDTKYSTTGKWNDFSAMTDTVMGFICEYDSVPGSVVVIFDANGGFVSTKSKTVIKDSTYGTLPTPTKDNCVFEGWYTSPNGGTRIYSDTNVTLTNDQTLYAHWTEIHSHNYVTGNDKEHPHNEYKTCSDCGDKYYTGNTKKVSGCEECYPHEHSYYTGNDKSHPHKEYKKCSDCGDKYYTGSTKKVSGCEECYTVTKTYTITYNANGGEKAPASQTKNAGESIKLRNIVPYKQGYVFAGWAESLYGNVKYYPNDTYSADKNLTLYAVWKVYKVDTISLQTSVTIPTFKVTLSGRTINNTYRQYPLIVYNDITYFPMTYYDSRLMGLETGYSQAEGLSIWQTSGNFSYQETNSSTANSGTYTATVAQGPIYVNGKFIDNSNEEYPLLLFRDVTYFPLTWRFAVQEFGWSYYFDMTNGLVISK